MIPVTIFAISVSQKLMKIYRFAAFED